MAYNKQPQHSCYKLASPHGCTTSNPTLFSTEPTQQGRKHMRSANMSDRLILKTCNVQPVHEILRCAVKFKGIETSYQTLHDGPPQFIDHGNAIVGLHNIIAHLEDRFPAPPLLLGDAMARSRQRMIFWQIVERAQRNEIAELLEEFSPYVTNTLLARTFLTGENPTIVDIAVAALCINGPSPYAEFRHVITEFCGQQMEVA